MKIEILQLLLIMLTLSSCATRDEQTNRIQKIADASWDSFADETFLRWDEKRLKGIGESPVVECYLNNTDKGLVALKENFTHRSKDPLYWLKIGNCYLLGNNQFKAEFYYRLALEQSGHRKIRAAALNNLALLNFRWGLWGPGKDYLQESQKQAPELKVPRYNLAQLYLQFGLYDEAIDLLKNSKYFGQKDPDIYFSLANAYVFKGDFKEAEKYFGLIPDETLRSPEAAATYAYFLQKNGDTVGALKVLQERRISSDGRVSRIIRKIEQILQKKEE